MNLDNSHGLDVSEQILLVNFAIDNSELLQRQWQMLDLAEVD